MKKVGVRPGDNLVDFGCRVGHYSIPAAFVVEHSGTVYAMDQDPKPVEEVRRFLQEELPGHYTYTTTTIVYEDRRQVRHVRLQIKGWIGLSRQMNRYNPLDITCSVCTESPASA